MLKYISSLPLDEDPEIFGLHSNANILYEQKTVKAFMETILAIQPREASSADAKTPEELCMVIAKEIEKKLPKLINTKRKSEKSFSLTASG